ncbi:unnamed protein product [Blepharisma stoltei]|uniref:Uncharacterized protein n=1 Tax=Blepharisma stoltei TaxID=1481888 RepID=A0AAU9ITV1_9CILI|nr:unnamed protein product [Blepharisma stoltei]
MSLYCINDKLLFDSKAKEEAKAPIISGLYLQLVNTNQALEKHIKELRNQILTLQKENKELRDLLQEKDYNNEKSVRESVYSLTGELDESIYQLRCLVEQSQEWFSPFENGQSNYDTRISRESLSNSFWRPKILDLHKELKDLLSNNKNAEEKLQFFIDQLIYLFGEAEKVTNNYEGSTRSIINQNKALTYELKEISQEYNLMKEKFEKMTSSPYDSPGSAFYKEVESWVDKISRFFCEKVKFLFQNIDDPITANEFLSIHDLKLPLTSKQQEYIVSALKSIMSAVSYSDSPKRSINRDFYETEMNYQSTIQRLSLELCDLKKEKDLNSTYREDDTVKETWSDIDEGVQYKAEPFQWRWSRSNYGSENY